MGTYTHLKGELEPLPQDQSSKERTAIAKSKFNGFNLARLGEEFNKVKTYKEDIEKELKGVNENLEALTHLIVGKMEEEQLSLVRLTDGGSLYLLDKPYCQVVNQQEFLAWVKGTGREDLLSVHYQKMNSLTSELLLEGQQPPPGIKAFMKTSLGRRKS